MTGIKTFTCRAMLLAVLAMSMPLACEANRLRRQRRAVAAVESRDGGVVYDHNLTGGRFQLSPGETDIDAQLATESGTRKGGDLRALWERYRDRVLPEDFGCRAVGVRFFPFYGEDASDDALIAAAELSHIEFIDVNGGGWQGTGNPGYQPVTDAVAAHLSRLKSLRWLDLAGTQITDATLKQINALPHLECLFLDDTYVSDEGMRMLCRLPELRELSVARTDITDRGLLALAGCRKLVVLEVYGTQITPEGGRAFETSLPRCEVRGLDKVSGTIGTRGR